MNGSVVVCSLLACSSAACTSNNSVSSTEDARRAYLGLDKSITKALELGFAGFNAATSANIPTEMTAGDASGTVAVTGQVDQGSSANKEMRLYVGLTNYSDGPIPVDNSGDTVSITYATSSSAQPYLDLMLRGIPTGTLGGSLTGAYTMTGDLTGTAMLSVTFAGTLMAGPSNTVTRVVGTTTVTGTATSNNGTYQIDVTL